MPNISRSKWSQTMKFGQLIEYNMRNIFLKKSYPKWGEKTSPRPFSKNQNWAYLWINSLKFYTISFYSMSTSSTTKIYLKKGAIHFLLPPTKLLKKIKNMCKLSPWLIFKNSITKVRLGFKYTSVVSAVFNSIKVTVLADFNKISKKKYNLISIYPFLNPFSTDFIAKKRHHRNNYLGLPILTYT